MGPTWKISSVAALAFGAAGALVALVVIKGARGEGWWTMIPSAGLAAALLGALLWRWLVVSHAGATRLKATLVGGLTGLLAHPAAWYLSIFLHYLTGTRSSLGEPTAGPIEGVWGAFVLSFWSVFLIGWITIPVGAAVGFLLGNLAKPSSVESG